MQTQLWLKLMGIKRLRCSVTDSAISW